LPTLELWLFRETLTIGPPSTPLIEWQSADPSLDELRDWIHANRYIRGLTCEEREQYRVEPLCELEEAVSTAMP
jgi:hypothetical protein